MKIKAIIIEDEEPARMLLKKYLANHSGIELIGEYADGFSGLKAINEQKPDLIFLDIQMPKLNGFEILELSEYHSVVVFTTAYDQFAIKAFESNAVDYLLKPFTQDRFNEAVKKAAGRISNNTAGRNEIQSVISAMDEKNEIIERIAVRSGSKIHVIPCDEVIFIEADGDYVKICTNKGNFLKEKTMKYFEARLDPKQFVRIHRSSIANVDFIQRLEYYDKEHYIAVLKNNSSLKVSANGYKLLRNLLNL